MMERLKTDDFLQRPHFQAEMQGILEQSLPYKLMYRDARSGACPRTQGRKLIAGRLGRPSTGPFHDVQPALRAVVEACHLSSLHKGLSPIKV